jgi:hypothetical protein
MRFWRLHCNLRLLLTFGTATGLSNSMMTAGLRLEYVHDIMTAVVAVTGRFPARFLRKLKGHALYAATAAVAEPLIQLCTCLECVSSVHQHAAHISAPRPHVTLSDFALPIAEASPLPRSGSCRTSGELSTPWSSTTGHAAAPAVQPSALLSRHYNS